MGVHESQIGCGKDQARLQHIPAHVKIKARGRPIEGIGGHPDQDTAPTGVGEDPTCGKLSQVTTSVIPMGWGQN